MLTIAVIEKKDSATAGAQIACQLKKQAGKYSETAVICISDSYDFLKKQNADLLVIAPGVVCKSKMKAKCALLPGYLPEGLEVKTDYAVSYGMSPRDTITASSISEDSIVISLQRELVTLSGEVLERQEFPKFSLKKHNPELAMVLAGTLLLIGAERPQL